MGMYPVADQFFAVVIGLVLSALVLVIRNNKDLADELRNSIIDELIGDSDGAAQFKTMAAMCATAAVLPLTMIVVIMGTMTAIRLVIK